MLFGSLALGWSHSPLWALLGVGSLCFMVVAVFVRRGIAVDQQRVKLNLWAYQWCYYWPTNSEKVVLSAGDKVHLNASQGWLWLDVHNLSSTQGLALNAALF